MKSTATRRRPFVVLARAARRIISYRQAGIDDAIRAPLSDWPERWERMAANTAEEARVLCVKFYQRDLQHRFDQRTKALEIEFVPGADAADVFAQPQLGARAAMREQFLRQLRRPRRTTITPSKPRHTGKPRLPGSK